MEAQEFYNKITDEFQKTQLENRKEIQQLREEVTSLLKNPEPIFESNSQIIELNVGGRHFTTYKSTLARFNIESHSKFSKENQIAC